jgi:hypothetical protein
MRTRLSVLTAVTASVLALAGCQQSAVPGSPQQENGSPATAAQQPAKPDRPDPKALISNAAKTTRESTSCKFEWKAEIKAGGETGVGLWTSTGAMDFRKNRSTIESTMDLGGGPKMKLAIISDGTTVYMRSAMDGIPAPAWKKMDIKELEQSLGQLGGGGSGGGGQSPGRDPMSFIDEIKEIATVTPDGSETIRGVPTTRYNVAVDPGKSPLGVGTRGR